MSWLSKMFGGSGPKVETKPEEYEGFAIYPEPIREGQKWRVSARIEKEIDGEVKSHTLIRADTLDDEETARTVSAGKARQMIDEQGDRLF